MRSIVDDEWPSMERGRDFTQPEIPALWVVIYVSAFLVILLLAVHCHARLVGS
jgi:hypothetical protein